MTDDEWKIVDRVFGFLSRAEAELLYEIAGRYDPIVEIGSFAGRSTVAMALAKKSKGGGRVISIDHHHGSEEQQIGMRVFRHEYYDPELNSVNTWPAFLENIKAAGVARYISAWKAESDIGLQLVDGLVEAVFIDASHDVDNVWFDAMAWGRKLKRDGALAFHDYTTHDGPKRVGDFLVQGGYADEYKRADSLLVLEVPNPAGLPDPKVVAA